jgi:hypothetical protein
MQRVDVRGHTDKLGLVDQAIRRGADFALGDEFIQRRPRNAELAGRVRFAEPGHGRG